MQKCMYCGVELQDDRPVTVCDKCGAKVWGDKMFNAIKQNMSEARERGDLCHENVFIEDRKEPDNSGNLGKF